MRSISNAWSYGGAVYFESGLTMRLCCSTACSSSDYSGFADLSASSGSSAVNSTSVQLAETNGEAGAGTISLFSSTTATFTSVNFTQCFVSDYGSAFALAPRVDSLAAAFLTLVGLTDGAAIWSEWFEEQLIDHCNFYNNHGGAVLSTHDRGMTVSWCIFAKNSLDIEIRSWYTESIRYRMSHCVFSGPFPSDESQVLLETDNWQTLTTASFDIRVVTDECPMDLLPPASASSSFSSSGSVPASLAVVASLSISGPSAVFRSPHFPRSSLIDRSPYRQSSFLMALTGGVLCTASLPASADLAQSASFAVSNRGCLKPVPKPCNGCETVKRRDSSPDHQ
jgi:hypothetical protein